jgi:hypothetical protein
MHQLYIRYPKKHFTKALDAAIQQDALTAGGTVAIIGSGSKTRNHWYHFKSMATINVFLAALSKKVPDAEVRIC